MKSHHISTLICAPAGDSASGAGPSGAADTLAQAKQSITQAARDAKEKIKSTATGAAQRVKDEGGQIARDKKEKAAERVGGYSSALHETARKWEGQDGNIAWFAHRAADRLQNAADYMRQSDFRDVKRDAEDIARRHPAVFFGGLFVAGLVLGNVLKASPRGMAVEDRPDSDDDGGADETENLTAGEDAPGASAAGY